MIIVKCDCCGKVFKAYGAKAAKAWKPLKAGPRWDAEALRWYRAIWNAAKGRVKDAQDTFLEQLTNITRKGQKLALRFRSEGAARTAAAFIADNDLAGDSYLHEIIFVNVTLT